MDDQGNAVWTAARSAGAEGPDTDRARDLKLSASVDVSELATDPMACENPDQASFSDFVPSSVRAVICPMELDEEFLTAPPGERPPLPGDKEEGQECRAFHPSAVKAFKIQTRLNATTIAQEEAKKADQVEAVERSVAVLYKLQGGAIGGLPWARYSDELNQQAKAGDRPYLGDLRFIFWAAPHDPDEDSRPGHSQAYWGCLGTATLRQLWGVWESLPLLQGPRQRGPKNKAQNQTRLAGWETLKEDVRCFLKEEGLPFPQTGPEW